MLKKAVKDDAAKAMVGLVSWIFLKGLAMALTHGAKKYAAHNWRMGLLLSRTFDALMRHLWAFWSGENIDADSGLPHLDCAAAELMFLRELWETRPDLDDRYKGNNHGKIRNQERGGRLEGKHSRGVASAGDARKNSR